MIIEWAFFFLFPGEFFFVEGGGGELAICGSCTNGEPE